jgi:hypothetical protein
VAQAGESVALEFTLDLLVLNQPELLDFCQKVRPKASRGVGPSILPIFTLTTVARGHDERKKQNGEDWLS